MDLEQMKYLLMRNGAREPFFDVREGDLKKQVNAFSEQHSVANVKKAPGCMQPGLICELLVLFYILVGRILQPRGLAVQELVRGAFKSCF
jgi:hypothetical protein